MKRAVKWGAGRNRAGSHSAKQHAYALDGPRDLAESAAEYRRSFQLRAVCGTSWSDLEPLPASSLPTCRTCARLAPKVADADQASPDLAAMVAEFHAAFGEPFGNNGGRISNAGRIALHNEENTELVDELEAGNTAGIARELADVVYIAYGTAHSLGIPLDAVLAEIHRAAMSKVIGEGLPIMRADGKVLKPPGFVPPDVVGAMRAAARNLYDEELTAVADPFVHIPGHGGAA